MFVKVKEMLNLRPLKAKLCFSSADSSYDLTDTWFFCVSFKTIKTSILNVNTANIKHLLIRAPG